MSDTILSTLLPLRLLPPVISVSQSQYFLNGMHVHDSTNVPIFMPFIFAMFHDFSNIAIDFATDIVILFFFRRVASAQHVV